MQPQLCHSFIRFHSLTQFSQSQALLDFHHSPDNTPAHYCYIRYMALVDDGLGDLTYRIIGICMAVHNDLGPGHREIVYHRALEQKLIDSGIAFESEPGLEVVDEDDNTLIIYRPDFRIERKLFLEIKALSHLLTNDQMAQAIDYLAADAQATCKVALLVNFGRPRLEPKRLFAPKPVERQQFRKKWGTWKRFRPQ